MTTLYSTTFRFPVSDHLRTLAALDRIVAANHAMLKANASTKAAYLAAFSDMHEELNDLILESPTIQKILPKFLGANGVRLDPELIVRSEIEKSHRLVMHVELSDIDTLRSGLTLVSLICATEPNSHLGAGIPVWVNTKTLNTADGIPDYDRIHLSLLSDGFGSPDADTKSRSLNLLHGLTYAGSGTPSAL